MIGNGLEGTIKIYNKNGYLEKENAHSSAISRFKLLPNGLMASASPDNNVKIWNTKTWSLIRNYTEHTDSTYGLEYILNDKIASGSYTINIWKISTGQTLKIINVGYLVLALQLLTNGLLASGDSSGLVKLWNVTNGELVQTLQGHTGNVNDLVLINDLVLASSSDDRTIRLWNIQTLKMINVLKGHTDQVFGLKMISSSILASASHDRTIKIWNSTSGEIINTLYQNERIFWALDVLNENVLVSGSYDKTVKIWNVFTGELIENIDVDMLIWSLILI